MSAARDDPRLMHRRSQYGYTTDPSRAVIGEPEAVSADVQREITASARRSAEQAKLDEWRERRAVIAREIEWLTSQRFQRDVRTQVRALTRQLDRIDERLTTRV